MSRKTQRENAQREAADKAARAELTAQKRVARWAKRHPARGRLICHRAGCTLPPGHNDGAHGVIIPRPPRSSRRASGNRTQGKGRLVLHRTRTKARATGVALASPTSLRGLAQRAELGIDA